MEQINNNEPIQHPASRVTLTEQLVNIGITALLTLLPLLALVFIFKFVWQLIERLVHPISSLIGSAVQSPIWVVDIVSVTLITLFLLLFGLLIENQRCKSGITQFEEKYLCQLPFYSSLRDIVRRFSGKEKSPFSQVALVDIYNNGILSTAFVTEKINEELYTVFVPTAPNPTNGYIFHVPVSKMQLIDTPADIAMRSVISMGTGSSVLFSPPTAKEVSMRPQQKVG